VVSMMRCSPSLIGVLEDLVDKGKHLWRFRPRLGMIDVVEWEIYDSVSASDPVVEICDRG
jgi:hypothetical protein